MFNWCLWKTTLLLFISLSIGQRTSFPLEQGPLIECLKNHLLLNGPYFKTLFTVPTENIAKYAAAIFANRSVTRKEFSELSERVKAYATKVLVKIVKPQEKKHVKLAVEQAIEDCSNDGNINLMSLPYFSGESKEVAELLDFVLVDWEAPPEVLIRSAEGRARLTRYANLGLARLWRALDRSPSTYHLRTVLRALWTRRARRYFDGRTGSQYIPHRFVDGNVYTLRDTTYTFLFRRIEDYQNRNPPVEQSLLDDLENVYHGSYRSLEFEEYERNGGMSSADYHIESHVSQFFRILIVIVELERRGISSSEPVPRDLLHALGDELACRNYIIRFMNEELDRDMDHENDRRNLEAAFNNYLVNVEGTRNSGVNVLTRVRDQMIRIRESLRNVRIRRPSNLVFHRYRSAIRRYGWSRNSALATVLLPVCLVRSSIRIQKSSELADASHEGLSALREDYC